MQYRKQGRGLSATRRLVLSAVFAALAFVVMLTFRFNVQFLTFDLKDAVITVAGLLLGPVTALSVSVLVAVLEFITVSDTGIYGLIMNMASSVTFSVVASVAYKYRKRLSGAIMALSGAVVSLVAVMLLLNLVVTPLFMGATRGDVVAMIPTLLLPFNVVKALANASLVMVFYKPISRAVQAAGLLPHSAPAGSEDVAEGLAESPTKSRRWVSFVMPLIGLLLLAAAILFFRLVLKGQFELFR